MRIYGPLRVSLFIYEIIRLILMVTASPFQDPSEAEAFSEKLFPYAVYLVPNALFPLMTYFLLIRLAIYQTYLPLYIAGKIIGAVSIIGWAVFSLGSFIPPAAETLILITGVMLLIAACDALAACAGLALNRKLAGLPQNEL